MREEVAIEELTEDEVVILSPEPCRADERLTLEIPGDPPPPRERQGPECRPVVVARWRHPSSSQAVDLEHDGAKAAEQRGARVL